MRLTFSVLALLVVVSSGEIAPVAGTQHVQPIFEKADLVCNCAVKSLKVLGQQRLGTSPKIVLSERVVATVEVEDLYKPADPPGILISVEFRREVPATRALGSPLQVGERALMFLKSTAPLQYVFADPVLGAVQFSSIPAVPDGEGLGKLQAAIMAVLGNAGRDDQIRALQLLEGFAEIKPHFLSAITTLSRSPDADTALYAFAVLLSGKTGSEADRTTLKALNEYLEQYKGGSEPEALVNIGSELGQMNDNGSLREMESLATSRFVEIRRGAMQALRAEKSPLAAATLVGRLDDSDGYVRYLAVISLAETFGKHHDYAPSMYLCDKNPDTYVNLWTNWWKKEGPTTQQ